ncbi:MAG: hypothetical protein ACREMO_08450 [Gemmatimonadales bacterium]
MTHLSIEELIGVREPGLEPGTTAARQHLAECPACQAELERLHQRAARLRALPALRPSRDQWPAVRQRLEAERRSRRVRWLGAGGLAVAASVAVALLMGNLSHPRIAAGPGEISETMARSHALEQAIESYRPESRVTDGATARAAGELEDRIAVIDRQLEMAQLLEPEPRDQTLLRLWRERVGLLDALVDVHVTHANQVGL